WNELSKVIEDPTCFVRPLGLKALLEAADADREVALALLAKRTPVLMERIRKGEIRGEKRGKKEGRREGLVEAITWYCEFLGIELSQERRTALQRADETALRAWVDHLKTHRQWPGGDMLS
ncbi:MAG: hypothetical protein WCI05_19655, partial [Myxococcales bacterium]